MGKVSLRCAAVVLALLLAGLLLWPAARRPRAATPPGTVLRAARGRPAAGGVEPVDETAQEGLRLTLCRGQGAAEEPFRVENMLPGDAQTRLYCVRAYHEEGIELLFTVKNLRATGGLEQALRLRVTRLADSTVLCDGPVADALGAVYSTALPGGNGQTDSWYSVEAYLPTDTGNEYQQTQLLVDLNWYCEAEQSLTGPGAGGWLGTWLPAQTGDAFPLWLLLAAAALSLCALIRLARRRAVPAADRLPQERAETAALPAAAADCPPGEDSAARRLLRRGAAVFLLLGLLAVTTFALAAASVQVEDNRFETGRVELALYKAAEHPLAGTVDALMEPGKTLIRTFELVNNSTADVYCRLYLDRAEGPLCGYVTFTVAADGQTYTASASAFTRRQAYTLPEALAPGERRTVEVRITMPAHTGNAAQNAWLTYSLAADATQVRNNPERLF